MNCSVFCRRVASTLILIAPVAAACADAILAETPKVAITTIDLRADVIRIPTESRKEVLSKPENVLQLASNLAVRRELAAEAEAAGMAKDPTIEAAIRLARDKVLSDALIAKIDAASRPKPELLDALALTHYKANPERFKVPPETHARHILIKREVPDARAAASTILAELKAGADFATLAKEKSQDPGTAATGGDLGYFGAGRMVAPFDAALGKLQRPGELSDLVETQFGYHIIRLENRRAAGIRPFEEVKVALRPELESKIVQDARMVEVNRIQQGIRFNNNAIKDFAASVK